MLQDLGPKKLKLKWGDIWVWTRCDFMVIKWMETSTVHQQKEISVVNKPLNMADCNHHVGYVASWYFITCRIWKWTKELFVWYVCLFWTVTFFFLSSCGWKKISPTNFQFVFIRNVLAPARQEPWVAQPLGDYQGLVAVTQGRLDCSCSKHCPVPFKWLQYCVFS